MMLDAGSDLPDSEVVVRSATLILAAMMAVAALAYLGVIGGYVAFLGVVAIVLVAAWLFDRGRRLGARAPYLDANRGDYPANAGSSIRPVPSEAVTGPREPTEPA
jgi:hypothetical protein